MNILVLGSGGREHTICWKIAQSPKCNRLFAAPGNAGTSQIATNLNLLVTDFIAIKDAVISNQIDMVIVGPEDPLVLGIHDYFLNDASLSHISVIGPQKEAAQLEGSKAYAKAFMKRHNIPTASYRSFTSHTVEEGKNYLKSIPPPYVLKADGLAAGKGVMILNNLEDAVQELEAMLIDAKFGDASSKVVIEGFLDGIELSCFVLTDGTSYKVLPTAKDYKRIGEGDTGLNTGGMGAVSPALFVDHSFTQKIHERIIVPTIKGLSMDKIPFVGFVFIGLIKVNDDPYVIEYNVRMGDPETQVVFPRIKSDLVDLFQATSRQRLKDFQLEIDSSVTTTVVAVSEGYPEAYSKGKVISGLDQEALIFHAGTKLSQNKVLTNGGRVLAVTSQDESMQQALASCYNTLNNIRFQGINFRKDIGFDL